MYLLIRFILANILWLVVFSISKVVFSVPDKHDTGLLAVTGLLAIAWLISGLVRRKKKHARLKSGITSSNANGALMILDGVTDILEVFENKVSITPKKTGSALILKGVKGTKSIPFKSITAIQFREANAVDGYIQFSIVGGTESRGGIIAGMSDENTVSFIKPSNDHARKIRDFIEARMGILDPASTPAQSLGKANISDQLAQLSELKRSGALSDDEFIAAKTKVLSNAMLIVLSCLSLCSCGTQTNYQATAPGAPLPQGLIAGCVSHDMVGRCTRWTSNSKDCINPKGMDAQPPVVSCSSIGKGL